MPPWVASAPRLSSLITGRAIERTPAALRCRNAARRRSSNLRVRSASTQVSPTAINLRPNIPRRNKELHDALSELSGAAETYVNISRLQLALSGLAAQDAVTRVAVLGLNSQVSAQRLARLLLADPLGAEERWEKGLISAGDGNERAVLLKYGEEGDNPTPSPLYKVLSIPSRVLRSHNLEMLVSTLNVHVANTTISSIESSKEAVLVPKLQATSARGLPVPYPVHKTLVFGEGIDSAIAFGRLASDNVEDLPDTVKLAIDLPAPEEETSPDAQSASTPVNLQVGTKAIATFRESIQNSIAYERGWYRSGLPSLSSWLTHDLQPTEPMKPVLKTFVASILDDVEAKITKEDTDQLQKLTALPSSHETTASIVDHLETWAEKSHTELRDELDAAFTARNWYKLAWWKLLWRVDDISMISSEILERRWLVSAEKSSIYLAGRMNQAGFPDELQKLVVNSTPEVTTEETAPTAENPRLDISTDVRKPLPWPEHIAAARTELINENVPPLQALAQRLILQTFSTTSLSSALSALLYVSVSSFSVFEASAVGVLGLTFSLRRMQKLWEGARESWQSTVREEGRRTLKATEETVRLIIKNKEDADRGIVVVDESVRERKEAREAVARVRESLERLGGDVK
ncbi:hypothetical protein CC86DRAFT_350006 [Ophiobolus disseminans]|uniref:Mmc1 C-terminal domain-containing protein n=1 Tax=Ophiobolus disseminans TaxID=1469910 RepID=A0A6A7A279_9PLEO|nr:hypothetical protein CC86DRAFT_350006 [Ophiobolus disseminans]